MKDLISILQGGDRRSIGRVDEVIRRLEAEPAGFQDIVNGLLSPDEVVRMRCADAIEKSRHAHPDWLAPHALFFLEQARRQTQQEVRWHMAQIIPQLPLTQRQRAQAIDCLKGYLGDPSGIVRVNAMQGLAELSQRDSGLRKEIVPLINRMMKNGTPAVKARGRKLLKRIDQRKVAR